MDVVPWGGLANVGKDDETGESGASDSGLDDTEEPSVSRLKSGGWKGMWNPRVEVKVGLLSAGLTASRREERAAFDVGDEADIARAMWTSLGRRGIAVKWSISMSGLRDRSRCLLVLEMRTIDRMER